MSSERAASPPGAIDLGGQTYSVARPTESDVLEVARWARERAKALADPYRRVAEGLEAIPQELRRYAVEEAARAKRDGEVSGEDMQEALTSPDGVAYLAWVLTRRLNPGVTLQALRGAITEENCLEVYAGLDRESGMGNLAALRGKLSRPGPPS